MKRLILFLVVVGLASACTQTTTESSGSTDSSGVMGAEVEETEDVALPDPDAVGGFGAAITADGAVAATEVVNKLGKADSVRVKVRGEITSCCQSKGCWMTMPISADKDMTVKFKDYAFFVPKNSAGKEAVIDGWVYREELSVDELRHYAEDEGKPQEEIDKITKPEERIIFMADGVIIAPAAEAAH